MARQRIKKLLFVLPGLDTGGSEHVVSDLANGLPRTRYKPMVFSILKGPLETTLKGAGIETIVSRKRKGEGHIQLLLDLFRIIRRYQIDIVLPHHFVSLFYSFWGTKLRPGTKLIFTEHSVMEINALSIPYRLLATLILFMSTGCIAISRQIGDGYREKLKVRPSKIFHIPNGIEMGRFIRPLDIEKKRTSLGILPGTRVVGSIANITVVKNHSNLIRAFSMVAAELDRVVLLLAGSGPLENDMKALANDLHIADKILFLGRRSDVEELYRIFDVFCLSSFSEGFPLAILEAMASKVPVIATDVVGNNEIIEDGKNGILVPLDNPDELARSLIHLLRNEEERIRLGNQGFDTVRNRYSFNHWMDQYDHLFGL